MNSIILQPGSDTSIRLSYLTLATTLITITSYNFINSLSSVAEKLLVVGFSSSLVASLFVIVNFEKAIERLYIRTNLTKREYVRTAKQAPLKKFYSSIISQIILAISFSILALASLFSPFTEIPDGILFDLLKFADLRQILVIIFGFITIFLSYRIFKLYEEYKPRLQRASVYYLLLKDKNVHSRKNTNLDIIDDYGSALTLNDWSTEESKFNRLKRDYYEFFIESLNNFKAFINMFGSHKSNINDLNYFYDAGKSARLLNSNYINHPLKKSKDLGIQYFGEPNTNIHLKLVKLLLNVEKLNEILVSSAIKILNENFNKTNFENISKDQKSKIGEILKKMFFDSEIYQNIIEDTNTLLVLLTDFINEFEDLSSDPAPVTMSTAPVTMPNKI